MILEIENGKYTFVFDETVGVLEILRNGQPWRDETGNNALLCLMQECERLREFEESQLDLAADAKFQEG